MDKVTPEVVLESVLGLDLDYKDAKVLAELATMRHLSKGDVLYSAGERTAALYVIQQGDVAVTNKAADQSDVILHILHQGALAGELSFIDDEKHSTTLIAQGDAEVMVMSREAFLPLIESHPQVAFHVMRSILRSTHAELRRLNKQYLEMNRFIHNEYMA